VVTENVNKRIQNKSEFIIRWRVNNSSALLWLGIQSEGLVGIQKGDRPNLTAAHGFPVGEKNQTSSRKKNHFSVEFFAKRHRAIRNTRRGTIRPRGCVCCAITLGPALARKSLEYLNNFGREVLNRPAYIVVPTRRQMISFISPFSKDRTNAQR